MRIAREGRALAVLSVATAAVVTAVAGWLPGLVCAAVAVAVCAFFRDPHRTVPRGQGLVVAPADGRVLEVTPEVPGREPGSPASRVRIFLAPWNVHVNRTPVAGTVVDVEYRRGRFRAAFSPKSDLNEHNAVVLRDGVGHTFRVVQIAGWLARRIVCHCQPGQELARGERYGLIMFGSRVDLYVPPSVRLTVRPGARVRGGETILGVMC